jgi:2-keto-4-pentenoate hydratase/2-oxohepta-3-ene-1,7-dioic acid hydratase in catechol pathway
MKLARFESKGQAQLGVVEGATIIPLDGLGFASMMSIVAEGEAALRRIAAHLEGGPASLPLNSVKLLAPLERPGKYLAIGMNYGKHAEEAERMGIAKQAKQYWFNKQTSCLAGPNDAIEPGVTEKLDYECELGVVIGAPAKRVGRDAAMSHVFGYVVANDVSARDWQHHSPSFTMGKSFDTHGPIGPWIVTADEIADPQALDVKCWVNGELRQSTNTREMIHSIVDQIEYLSTAFTLESGDLLATGTPEGVGAARTPPLFLQSGDVVRCEVECIGTLENRVA